MGKRFFRYIGKIVDCVLELIYAGEETCEICTSVIVESETVICKNCREKIQFCDVIFQIGPSDDEKFTVYSASYYGKEIRELILNLKYKGNFRCGEVLSEFMTDTLRKNKIQCDVITYVPMYYKDENKRGFNQSRYLGWKISKAENKKLVKTLVKKNRTKDQIGLSGKERWMNLQNCFGVVNVNEFKGKTVLLVDDVITTGATAYSLANKLIKNGAKQVNILTAAKSRL